MCIAVVCVCVVSRRTENIYKFRGNIIAIDHNNNNNSRERERESRCRNNNILQEEGEEREKERLAAASC